MKSSIVFLVQEIIIGNKVKEAWFSIVSETYWERGTIYVQITPKVLTHDGALMIGIVCDDSVRGEGNMGNSKYSVGFNGYSG